MALILHRVTGSLESIPMSKVGGHPYKGTITHTMDNFEPVSLHYMCLDYGKKLESQEKTHEAQSEQSKVGIEPSNPKIWGTHANHTLSTPTISNQNDTYDVFVHLCHFYPGFIIRQFRITCREREPGNHFTFNKSFRVTFSSNRSGCFRISSLTSKRRPLIQLWKKKQTRNRAELLD